MNITNLKCTRCMHDLEVEEFLASEDPEFGNTTFLICPYCGAKYECTEAPENEKDKYEFYQNGEDIDGRITEPDILNGHCTNCGHKVTVSNNFMLSDYDDTITDENDDKMNFIMNECPYCGMCEVRWDNSNNEREVFPYWKENQQE
jgi:DNA-directed RNA polymerase subunit RPC12/RpoP